MYAYRRMLADKKDVLHWNRMSLANIAGSGAFSSDQSIKKYADEIWHLRQVGKH
jgi:starch phosphorylase